MTKHISVNYRCSRPYASVMKHWLGALVSGCVVYAFMAACGGTGSPSGELAFTVDDAGSLGGSAGTGSEEGGTGGSGDQGGTAGTGTDSGIPDSGIPDALADVFDALTDPVPDAVADTGSDATDPDDGSGSRLKAQRYAGTDGSSMPLLSMWDSELKTQCMFGLAADGSTRCLPAAFVAVGAYSDASCNVPLFRAPTGVTCGGGYDFGYTTAGSCGERAVFRLGATHMAQVYGGVPGSCIPIDDPCGSPQYNCELRAGSEMAPSEFVAAELVSG